MATARQKGTNHEKSILVNGSEAPAREGRSREDAVRQRLADLGVDVEVRGTEAFRERREAWAPEYRPRGQAGGWALDALVEASLQVDRCRRALNGVLAEHAGRARDSWDADRRVEAARIAARLRREPGLCARRLMTSWHGCELLVEVWGRLLEALDSRGEWTAAERSTALDLLGLPAMLREGRTPLDPSPGGDAASHLRATIVAEIDRLKALMERLAPLDDLERKHAEAGASGLLTKPAALILRFENAAWRRFEEAQRTLGSPSPVEPAAQVAAPPPPSVERPAPAPKPTPRPPAPADASGVSYLDIASVPHPPSAPAPSGVGHAMNPGVARGPSG